MKNASYIPFKMKVTDIKGLCPDTKALTLEFVDKKDANNFDFLSGQFIIISILGFGESVFAVTSSRDVLPKIEIAVRSVGNTTMAIHRLKVGDEVGMRGPYGKSYPFDKLAGRQTLVVAGGLGLAPLKSLIQTIEHDNLAVGKLSIFVGAKTPNDIIYKKELNDWNKFSDIFIAVNEADGAWKGHVGWITELFSQTKIDKGAIAIICGPPAMFAPVIKELEKYGLTGEMIYVMLERRMKCGIGKCQHCTCGNKYVCTDGPIFTWAELQDNWEAFV